jgi:hypothetical protein
LEDELEEKFGTVASRSGGLNYKELLLNEIKIIVKADHCQCVQCKILRAFTV